MKQIIKEALVEEGQEGTDEEIAEVQEELEAMSTNVNEIEFIGYNKLTREYFLVVNKLVIYRHSHKRQLFNYIAKNFSYTETDGFKHGNKEFEVVE